MTICRLFLSLTILSAGCAGCASVPGLKGASVNKPLPKAEAEAVLRRMDAERDEAQCQQAIRLWERGKAAEAEQMLEQIVARNPRHPQARRLLADLALSREDVQTAERILLGLINDHPDDQAAQASYAWLLESQGQCEQAQAVFGSLDPTFAASCRSEPSQPENR